MKTALATLLLAATTLLAPHALHGQHPAGAAATAVTPAIRPLRVVATVYPVYITALNVTDGIPGFDVSLLATVPPGTCLHDAKLSPADLRRLASADALVAHGNGLESFLPAIDAANPALPLILASGSETAGDDDHHHHDHDHGHSHAHDHAEPAPPRPESHAWVRPAAAAEQARAVASGLARLRPEAAADLRNGAEAYAARLLELDARLRTALAPARGTPVAVFHDAFPALARDLGLDVVLVVDVHAARAPSAGRIAAMARLLRSTQARALIVDLREATPAALALSRETGVPIVMIDPVEGGPTGAATARDAYLATMERNLATLRDALLPKAP